MKLARRLLSSSRAMSVLGYLASLYIRFVHATSRIEILGDFPEHGLVGESYVLAFWHGRLLMMPMMAKRFAGDNHARTIYIMISRHRDGELIARTMEWFGFRAVRGSSRRGGLEVARAAKRVLQEGHHLAITPDGPKGPAYQAQQGAVRLARLTGAPVLPVSFAASRAKHLRTWDRFALALPFGRLCVAIGEPLIFERMHTDAVAQSMLEDALNELTERAERAL